MANEKELFILEVAKYAQKYMRITQVPASLTIAQAILESNWGRSGLTKQNNNLFGIKGAGGNFKTKEFVNGKWITVTAGFRKYQTFEGSVKDHNEMLQRMPRYRKVIGEQDYRKACQEIWKAGYATDPTYPAKLIGLIETYGLAKYDDWEDDEMEKTDANAIIKLIQAFYTDNKSADEKAELNRLANVCRKLSGQKEQ